MTTLTDVGITMCYIPLMPTVAIIGTAIQHPVPDCV